jgi:hypothetical protein
LKLQLQPVAGVGYIQAVSFRRLGRSDVLGFEPIFLSRDCALLQILYLGRVCDAEARGKWE